MLQEYELLLIMIVNIPSNGSAILNRNLIRVRSYYLIQPIVSLVSVTIIYHI